MPGFGVAHALPYGVTELRSPREEVVNEEYVGQCQIVGVLAEFLGMQHRHIAAFMQGSLSPEAMICLLEKCATKLEETTRDFESKAHRAARYENGLRRAVARMRADLKAQSVEK